MNTMKLFNLFGGRKLVMGLLVMGIGITVDATFGLSSNLLYLLIFVCSGFFLSNGVEHASRAIRQKNGFAPENVGTMLQAVDQRLNSIQDGVNLAQQNTEKLQEFTAANIKATNSMLELFKSKR